MFVDTADIFAASVAMSMFFEFSFELLRPNSSVIALSVCCPHDLLRVVMVISFCHVNVDVLIIETHVASASNLAM